MYRLLNVHLYKVNLEVRDSAENPPDAAGRRGLDLEYSYDHTVDAQERRIYSTLGTAITAREGERPLFDLEVLVSGSFAFSEGEDLDPEEFAKLNAPAWLFPFLREIVANLTARLPYPPILLPGANVVKMSKLFAASEGRDHGADEDGTEH